MSFARGTDPSKPHLVSTNGGAFGELKLASGTWAHGTRQVVIDRHTAAVERFKVGDEIVISTLGKRHTFTLTGTVAFLGEELTRDASLAVWDVKSAQALFDHRGRYDVISVKAKTRRLPGPARAHHQAGPARRPPGQDARPGVRRGRGRLGPHDGEHPAVPAGLRPDRAGDRRVRDLQHAVDHRRPADPRAGHAADPRRLAPAGHAHGRDRGPRARHDRLAVRPRRRLRHRHRDDAPGRVDRPDDPEGRHDRRAAHRPRLDGARDRRHAARQPRPGPARDPRPADRRRPRGRRPAVHPLRRALRGTHRQAARARHRLAGAPRRRCRGAAGVGERRPQPGPHRFHRRHADDRARARLRRGRARRERQPRHARRRLRAGRRRLCRRLQGRAPVRRGVRRQAGPRGGREGRHPRPLRRRAGAGRQARGQRARSRRDRALLPLQVHRGLAGRARRRRRAGREALRRAGPPGGRRPAGGHRADGQAAHVRRARDLRRARPPPRCWAT